MNGDLGLGFVIGLVLGFWAGMLALAMFLSGRRPPPAPNAEPKLEQSWDVATVDRKTLRIVSARRVPLHHNTDPNARN
jgi:hypothetical protein